MPDYDLSKAEALAAKLRAYDKKPKNFLTKMADGMFLADPTSYGPVKAIYGQNINPEVQQYMMDKRDYEDQVLDAPYKPFPSRGASLKTDADWEALEQIDARIRERAQNDMRNEMRKRFGY
jgi:hypothetical protein